MTRCKSNASIPLPTLSVVRMLYDAERSEMVDVPAFTKNFAVAFLEIGLPRVTNSESNDLILPCLMMLIDSTPSTVPLSAQLVHILLSYLLASQSPHSSVPESVCNYVVKTSSTSNLYNFFIDLLIYRPPQALLPSAPNASSSPSPPASPSPPTSSPTPPNPPAQTTASGMTQAGTARLLSRNKDYFRSEKKVRKNGV